MVIPFAVGNFIYMDLADLVPDHQPRRRPQGINTVGLVGGLALLWSIAAAAS